MKSCSPAAKGQAYSRCNRQTLQPAGVYRLVEGCPLIATLENHTVNGGLGGLIAETLAQKAHPARLTRLGTQDTFTESGNSRQLKAKYGISGDALFNALR